MEILSFPTWSLNNILQVTEWRIWATAKGRWKKEIVWKRNTHAQRCWLSSIFISWKLYTWRTSLNKSFISRTCFIECEQYWKCGTLALPPISPYQSVVHTSINVSVFCLFFILKEIQQAYYEITVLCVCVCVCVCARVCACARARVCVRTHARTCTPVHPRFHLGYSVLTLSLNLVWTSCPWRQLQCHRF
jgi:hypothetical protein